MQQGPKILATSDSTILLNLGLSIEQWLPRQQGSGGGLEQIKASFVSAVWNWGRRQRPSDLGDNVGKNAPILFS
jgi:hypothetical protein